MQEKALVSLTSCASDKGFCSPQPLKLHMKFSFDWPNSFGAFGPLKMIDVLMADGI